MVKHLVKICPVNPEIILLKFYLKRKKELTQAFSALTLLDGRQEGHLTCKN